MPEPILIVEDEFFIALEMQNILQSEGYEVVGIAADQEGALACAQKKPVLALVDLHLRDGVTGPEIGARLAREYAAAVLFVTANPRILGEGVPGTIGVVTKPVDRQALVSAVRYALQAHRGMNDNPPPQGLVRFG